MVKEERDLLACTCRFLAEFQYYLLPLLIMGHRDHVPFPRKESMELHEPVERELENVLVRHQ